MSRGITTRAYEYDAEDDFLSQYVDQDVQLVVSKTSVGKNDNFQAANTRRCDAKPKRLLQDPRVSVTETIVMDPYEEEMKQRRLSERVRQVASKSNK
jgi:hypothetical protein